jgi:23S rRNA (cytidine1920-2'-O)/16S rRNA (cytidine1409-2'-O)-methyltransferase
MAGQNGTNLKARIDALLVERGLCSTRSQALALIMAGRVFTGEKRIDKAGTQCPTDVEIAVRVGPTYVSRGGDKLAGALEDLDLSPEGAVCVDVGASTGGFTDCLLQRGAKKVYAVDVGQGQLADKLRRDPRVVSRDRVNARHLVASDFEEPIDWVVVDASFIGIDKLIGAVAQITRAGGQLVALIKPQFEAGREQVRRGKGVIRDQAVRRMTIEHAVRAVCAAGFELLSQCDCRVRGPKGNVEHFLSARRQ